MNVNNFSKVLNAIALSKFGKRTPLAVVNKITFRCNLNCKYCGCWKLNRKEMTTEQIKKAMKEFADAGCVWWEFTGGEPTIRKDVGKLISYGKDLGLIVAMITNGLLVKKRIKEIKKLDCMYISFDGLKSIHEKLRGKGTHKKVLEAIRCAKENGVNVYPETVLSNLNIENDCASLKEAIRLANELDCKLTITFPYKDAYNKDFIDKYMPTQEMIERAIKFLSKEENKELVKVQRPYLTWSNKNNIEKKIDCYVGRLFCEVFPDGKVVPCLFKENQGIDGLKYGFVNAFNMLPTFRNCRCTAGYMEYNFFFSLNPKTLWTRRGLIKDVFLKF
jgi:MoaA/NifB/PqqE/SkfB family radical SAM enzyme